MQTRPSSIRLALAGAVALVLGVPAGSASAGTAPDVVANDDSGAGFATSADTAFTTGDVLGNDTNVPNTASPVTNVAALGLDGNATPQPIADHPSVITVLYSPFLGTQASGNGAGTADATGVDGSVTVAVNDTDFFANSGIGGVIRGSTTWNDVIVTGPGSSVTIAPVVHVTGSVSTTDAAGKQGISQVRVDVSVSGTPPGGGVATQSGLVNLPNQVPPVAIDQEVTTPPLTIDPAFPVTVEVRFNIEASIRTSGSNEQASGDITAAVTARLGGADGVAFDIDPTYTVRSISGSVIGTEVATEALAVESFDTTGTQGVVTDNGDGTFGYDPNGAFDSLLIGETATDTFTYVATDGFGHTDTATVTIEVRGAAAAPATTTTTTTTTTPTTTTVAPTVPQQPPVVTLPSTGPEHAGPMALVALMMLALGGAAVVAGRRP